MLEKIFSIKNCKDKKHKIIKIIGIKIKFKRNPSIKNVYVGCGDDSKPGYVGCDIRKTKNVKYVCKAWELSQKASGLENIYSRHMCEHLTFDEFRYTLKDWYKSLAPAGMIHIVVPNIDFHINQFTKAKYDLENIDAPRSDLSWALAGFWGWQRESYIKNDSKTKYWDVHKSGYNDKLMRLFLEEAGFVHISCDVIDEVHLSVMARKPVPHDYSLDSGERQIATTIDDIRCDHINRYELALNVIKSNLDTSNCLNGLDLFCGNGYGAAIVAKNLNTFIDAFDGSKDAIEMAQKYYKSEKINYGYRLFPFDLEKNKYDYVISLESIEHIADYKLFVSQISASLKENGLLIISTPNNEKFNLIKNYNPFHYRHYTNTEITELLSLFNLELIEMHGQDCYKIDENGYVFGVLGPNEMQISKDNEGQFTICILKKTKEK